MSELVVYVVAAAWAAALLAVRGRGPLAVLAGLSALSWLTTLLVPEALLWHRALVVHVLLAGGAWLPRSGSARGVTTVGYLAAVSVWPWVRPDTALALAAAISLAAAVERRHGTRSSRAGTWRAAVVLVAVAFAAPPLLAAAGLSRTWAAPVLVGYAGTQVVIAALVASAVRPWSAPWPTDVAVELAAEPRERLVRALATTTLDPKTVLEHARAAQAAAEELYDRLAARQEQLAATLADTEQSLRRLETVDAEERLAIRRALEEVAVARLRDAVNRLAILQDEPDPSGSSEPISRALHHLRLAVVEMDGLGQGLAPEALTEGLGPALSRLATTTPAPVTLELADGLSVATLPDDVAACVYFVAAEALANVVKHARAGSVLMRLTVDDPAPGTVELVVADDGQGMTGAFGTGITGLRARAEEVGGAVDVISRPGHGTQVRLAVPLRQVVPT